MIVQGAVETQGQGVNWVRLLEGTDVWAKSWSQERISWKEQARKGTAYGKAQTSWWSCEPMGTLHETHNEKQQEKCQPVLTSLKWDNIGRPIHWLVSLVRRRWVSGPGIWYVCQHKDWKHTPLVYFTRGGGVWGLRAGLEPDGLSWNHDSVTY